MKYRKKPIEVEAWQWTGKNIDDFRGLADQISVRNGTLFLEIEGFLVVSLERLAWFVRDPDGDEFVYKDSVFQKIYEVVVE